MTASLPFEKVAELNEVPAGGRKSIELDDAPVLLVRIEETYFAIEDVCTHDGQPLTDGPLVAESTQPQVVCPRHGAKFDLQTGAPLRMPATSAVRTFAVEVRSDGVYASAAPRPVKVATTPQAAPSSGTSVTSDGTSLVAVAPAETGVTSAVGAITDEAVLEALREVIDPELMINIVDLGLIYAVNREEQRVGIEMTLTSPACPAGPQIVQQSRMALERIPGVTGVDIRLTMSPPWTPDRMTDEARDQLGYF